MSTMSLSWVLKNIISIIAGNMNARGRERTAAGLGTVGRRWAGEGGGGLVSLL